MDGDPMDGFRAVNQAISDADLVQMARVGHQIEQETHDSETIKMLVRSAREDRQAALEDLAQCNPADIKAVTDAQFRYHVCNAVLTYIGQAIQQGQNANQYRQLADAPD